MANRKDAEAMVDRKDRALDDSQGTWEKGPIDWPDVPAVKQALEAWSRGAKLDFEVSEDLFYKLLSCKGAADDDCFDFSSGRIRWRDQSARNHAQRRTLEAMNADASIDFPTTLSRAASWYCFAQTFTGCMLPPYVIQMLEAEDYSEAETILQDAERAADTLRDKMAKSLLNIPQKPASGYFIATQARNEAVENLRVVKACLEALRTAESNKIKFAYLTELRSTGMSEARIDYPALLQLTTLGARTLGEGGDYALRMDGSRVIGIGPGSGSPAFDPVYEDGEMLAMANHQSDALLDLPTCAEKLVYWVFDQGGGVELAVPNIGRPETAQEWVAALAKLCESANTSPTPLGSEGVNSIASSALESQAGSKALQIVCTPRAKALQVLIAEAVAGIGTARGWPSSNEVISWLLSYRKDRARTHEARGNQYYEGRRWCRLVPDAVQPQLAKLKALNSPAEAERTGRKP